MKKALQIIWSILTAPLTLILVCLFGPRMDEAEARHLLSGLVAEYRQKSYSYWESRIDGEPIILAPVGASGCEYQVEICAFWDSGKGGDIRVIFSIGDGGWRAYHPMSDEFIIAADGSFVGE